MFDNYILNGQLHGTIATELGGQGGGHIAQLLLNHNGNMNCLRPWPEICPRSNQPTGRSFMSVETGRFNDDGTPVMRTVLTNATSTLRKNEWQRLESRMVDISVQELRVWGDVQRAGLGLTIPNGMGVTVLQHQTMSDAGEASISMDGMRKTNRDRPVYDLVNLPLPLIHSDFSFPLRDVLLSRNQGVPVDVTMIDLATRKVLQQVEKLIIGVTGSYSYGGGTIYGFTNYPYRITKTVTSPSGGSFTPQGHVDEVLDMVQSLRNVYKNGPYGLYYSQGWAKYLDGDYSSAYNGNTLRSRLRQIDRITSIDTVDFLQGEQMILWQKTSDTVQAVTGMPLRVIQWPSGDGMSLNYKIVCIMVPKMVADIAGVTGIVHATAA